jgi:mono/diheme cytochrome c family protein
MLLADWKLDLGTPARIDTWKGIFKEMMKFLLGLIIGLAVIPAVGFMYFRFGLAPVATSDPAMPFEKQLAGMALHARISKEAPAQTPIAASEENLAAGARIYRESCAFCHGIAGQAKTAPPKGMFPHPPQLFRGKGVTDDPAGEIYWTITNGIRLTGMPGFHEALTENQIWQVSLLLQHAHELPAPVKELVSQPIR